MKFHFAIFQTLSLRLAILYDAALPEQLAIIEEGGPNAEAAQGTIYGVERSFLIGIYAIRSGEDGDRLAAALADLRTHSRCEFDLRINTDH